MAEDTPKKPEETADSSNEEQKDTAQPSGEKPAGQPQGAAPPKPEESSKVQPKKETVRIN
jgi:hypothetical protein